MNVLIVDDNPRVREVIRVTIEDLASAIYECDNGESALNSYAHHKPDWILMDLEMAGGDGMHATRILKNLFAEAKVIIVTSHDSPALRRAAAEAGAYAYILKEDLYQLRGILR
jgi:DNA-binding NarL/FixJ family response regulator